MAASSHFEKFWMAICTGSPDPIHVCTTIILCHRSFYITVDVHIYDRRLETYFTRMVASLGMREQLWRNGRESNVRRIYIRLVTVWTFLVITSIINKQQQQQQQRCEIHQTASKAYQRSNGQNHHRIFIDSHLINLHSSIRHNSQVYIKMSQTTNHDYVWSCKHDKPVGDWFARC